MINHTSTSGLSVELLLRVIDVKYGYFTFLIYFTTSLVIEGAATSRHDYINHVGTGPRRSRIHDSTNLLS